MAGYAPNRITTSQIKSRILNIAQTSIYQVKLQPPSSVVAFLNSRGFSYATSGDEIELMCSGATLPGASVVTHDATNDYMGVNEKMAYRRMYDASLDLTFYVGRDYGVIEMFDGWLDYMSDGNPNTSPRNLKSPYVGYRMKYPETYRTNIFLSKFEKDVASSGLHYTFVGAFPTNISSMPVQYDQSDLLRCTVSMTYIRYVKERLTGSSNSTSTPVTSTTPTYPNQQSTSTNTPGRIASGMMLQRGQLGQDIQQAIRRQGLPLNTNRVRYRGRGSDMVVDAL